MIILGIETSCDETAIAIYDDINGLITEYIYTQEIHKIYGGTVPELSSESHLKNLFKLIFLSLKKSYLLITDISFISYTIGPGLKNSLLIGVVASKFFSFLLNIPSVYVNHLKAHIIVSFYFNSISFFPALVLFFSGAHSFFLEMLSFDKYFILSKTLDDSIGEVFDKIARSLKLKTFSGKSLENFFYFDSLFFDLNYFISNFSSDLSFSGFKSNVIKCINNNFTDKFISNFSYNIHTVIINNILNKLFFLLSSKKYLCVFLSGGVSANKILRLLIKEYCFLFNVNFFSQPITYCTDNGLMIAFLGFIKISNNEFDINYCIFVKPNLSIS